MEGVQERPQNVNTCCEGQGTRAFGSLPEYIYSLAAGGDGYDPGQHRLRASTSTSTGSQTR